MRCLTCLFIVAIAFSGCGGTQTCLKYEQVPQQELIGYEDVYETIKYEPFIERKYSKIIIVPFENSTGNDSAGMTIAQVITKWFRDTPEAVQRYGLLEYNEIVAKYFEPDVPARIKSEGIRKLKEKFALNYIVTGTIRKNFFTIMCLEPESGDAIWSTMVKFSEAGVAPVVESSDGRITIAEVALGNAVSIALQPFISRSEKRVISKTPKYQTTYRNGACQEMHKPGCYIATVAMEDNEAIGSFRNYRDEVLVKEGVGRTFVELYYIYGSGLAEKIKKNAELRRRSRKVLSKLLNEFVLPRLGGESTSALGREYVEKKSSEFQGLLRASRAGLSASGSIEEFVERGLIWLEADPDNCGYIIEILSTQCLQREICRDINNVIRQLNAQLNKGSEENTIDCSS